MIRELAVIVRWLHASCEVLPIRAWKLGPTHGFTLEITLVEIFCLWRDARNTELFKSTSLWNQAFIGSAGATHHERLVLYTVEPLVHLFLEVTHKFELICLKSDQLIAILDHLINYIIWMAHLHTIKEGILPLTGKKCLFLNEDFIGWGATCTRSGFIIRWIIIADAFQGCCWSNLFIFNIFDL